MLKNDTSPAVQQLYDELWRRLTPEERFRRGLALIAASRAMLVAGLRANFPQDSEDAFRSRLCVQLYGVVRENPS